MLKLFGQRMLTRAKKQSVYTAAKKEKVQIQSEHNLLLYFYNFEVRVVGMQQKLMIFYSKI